MYFPDTLRTLCVYATDRFHSNFSTLSFFVFSCIYLITVH